MCGILGFLNSSLKIADVEACLNTIIHRGPDGSGIFHEPEVDLFLGHRRLSIIDLEPTGSQPMESADGRYVIVYNGEIYNFEELRKPLLEKGVKFQGHSDTEVLLYSIILNGLEPTLKSLDGMFAFAFFDRKEKTLSLARDHIGEKPLYYTHIGQEFAFASELRSLEAHPDFKKELSRDALVNFFQFKFISGVHTVYEGVKKLLPGHYMVLKSGERNPEIHSYYSARSELQGVDELNSQDALANVHEALKTSIKRRLVADVPVGAFLSGGIDSSLIVSIASEFLTDPVKTFTVGFEDPNYDESGPAREVANYLKTDHHEITLSDRDILDLVPRVSSIWDEPFADISQIPTYLVSRYASERVKVVLSGDGADELFGGYNRYLVLAKILASPQIGLFVKTLDSIGATSLLGSAIKIYSRLRSGKVNVKFGNEQISRLTGVVCAKTGLQRYEALMQTQDSRQGLCLEKGVFPYREDCEFGPIDPVLELMLLDFHYFLPDDIFVKLDRASMAVSLEGRVPFVSRELVRAALSTPNSLKFHRDGNRKIVLKDILEKYIPRGMFERPKTGFGLPMGDWLKNQLKDWVEDLVALGEKEGDQVLQVKALRKTWESHKKGEGNWGMGLWPALNYLDWKRARNIR